MERLIYTSLKEWKDSPNRKPLILQGARQVGKTYILKEFKASIIMNRLYIRYFHNNHLIILYPIY